MKSVSHHVKKEIQDCPRHSLSQDFVVVIVFFFKGSPVLIFKQNCSFFPGDYFVLANSVDPDEMPHYAAFSLDLLCLQLKLQIKYAFIPL